MRSTDAADSALLVLTTTADDATALAISRALVSEGLAACVTRTAVRSVFRWEPENAADPLPAPVRDEAEVLLLIKTAKGREGELERRLLALHPYECPEVVVVEPRHVEAKYLAWLLGACSNAD